MRTMNIGIFRKLFYKNSFYFLMELVCAYGAAKVLVLGNDKLSKAIDAMFYEKEVDYINHAFWIYAFVLIALSFIFSFFQRKCSIRFGANMQTGFRKEAGEKIVSLKYRYFDTHSSASILNNLVADIREVSAYYAQTLPLIVTSLITVITVLTAICRIDIALAFWLMIILPVLIMISRYVNKKISVLAKKHWQLQDEVEEIVFDCLQGIIVEKSYNLEKEMDSRIYEANEKLLKYDYKRNYISVIPWTLAGIVNTMPKIALGVLALEKAHQGSITVGEMTYFFLLVDRMIKPLSELPGYLMNMKVAGVSKKRLREIMDFPKEQSGACADVRNRDCAVSFENVNFSYDGDKRVLDNLSFKINSGDKVAFVGESGGGKSTVFKLISGLYEADQGEVLLYGTSIKEWNLEEARKHMALVSQNSFLFPESIEWNVRCGANSHTREQVIAVCKKARIHDFIMSLPKGYDTNVGERGDLLSGGQKQRISIARALLRDADIILLDEPTSAIDLENERQIKEILNREAKDKTVITIAHRLSTIKDAECIFLLDKGKIAEKGRHEELLKKKGRYYEIYKAGEKKYEEWTCS